MELLDKDTGQSGGGGEVVFCPDSLAAKMSWLSRGWTVAGKQKGCLSMELLGDVGDFQEKALQFLPDWAGGLLMVQVCSLGWGPFLPEGPVPHSDFVYWRKVHINKKLTYKMDIRLPGRHVGG